MPLTPECDLMHAQSFFTQYKQNMLKGGEKREKRERVREVWWSHILFCRLTKHSLSLPLPRGRDRAAAWNVRIRLNMKNGWDWVKKSPLLFDKFLPRIFDFYQILIEIDYNVNLGTEVNITQIWSIFYCQWTWTFWIFSEKDNLVSLMTSQTYF